MLLWHRAREGQDCILVSEGQDCFVLPGLLSSPKWPQCSVDRELLVDYWYFVMEWNDWFRN